MDKDREKKVRSFNQYAKEVKTKRILEKAYKDHLLQQLAEATHSPAKNNGQVLEQLKMIDEKLNPVSKFFDKIQEPVKRVKEVTVPKTQEQIESEEEERQIAIIKAKAMAKINKVRE